MNNVFQKTASLLTLGAALTLASAAHAVSFDYSSTPGSNIVFNGASQFTFTPASNNFHVTEGTASGLLGEITGTYTIGAVTTVGPVSSASVSGTGTFVIHDGLNDLTGTLSWVDIFQLGAGNTVNTFSSVNLTNVTYGGVNPDLLALANAGSGINTLTFQFGDVVPLAQLKTTQTSTSFSGTVTSVPDGGTSLMMLGLALSGLAIIRRKFFV